MACSSHIPYIHVENVDQFCSAQVKIHVNPLSLQLSLSAVSIGTFSPCPAVPVTHTFLKVDKNRAEHEIEQHEPSFGPQFLSIPMESMLVKLPWGNGREHLIAA